ncbi:MAG: thiol reductant ABC exporter subunit CydC [Thiolinea sp.]
MRADIDRLDQVYLRLLLPVAVAILATLLFVAVLAWYHPWLALIELGMLLLAGGLVPWAVNRLGAEAASGVVDTTAAMRSALVNDLQGMGELWVYGAAARHEAQFQALSEQLAQQQRTLSHLGGIAQGALGLCANLASWLVLLVAIPLLGQGQIMPPDLAMLALLVLASFEAVAPLPLAFRSLGEMLAALRRVFALADQVPAVSEPAQPLPLQGPLHFSLQNVTFRYQDAAAAVLEDFSLELPPGSRVALVGSSGIGKSTLVSLLLRFREVQGGHIWLNQQPLAAYSSEDLRARIAVLPQRSHLFNQTIRDNLRLAKEDATQEELEQVCRLALLHDTIQQFPDGYETLTGETGLSLSGGQARRLALARALLKPADMLILDEPTEGLDPETAWQLLENVVAECERRGQSVLLITHQRQWLAGFERVVVLGEPASARRD